MIKGPLSKTVFSEFFRYITLGSISVLVDISVLYLLTNYVSFHYLPAAGISFLCGTLINYLVSVKYVFKEKLYNHRISILIFIITGLLGLIINHFTLQLLIESFEFNLFFSKIISIIIVTIVIFTTRKLIIFR